MVELFIAAVVAIVGWMTLVRLDRIIVEIRIVACELRAIQSRLMEK